MDNSKALERVKVLEPEVIDTPTAYAAAVAKWSPSVCNLLTPFKQISGLAPHHAIFSAVIELNPDKAAGDVYDGLPFLKPDEVAIAKPGLRKIADGLGISFDLEHLSVNAIRNYWLVRATAKYKGIDGAEIKRPATCEWDLRNGSPRLKGWTTNQIDEARKHGLRACETRAMNAAVRECGIRQAYKKSEIAKPFVTVRVSFQPDFNDAGTRAALLDAHLGATRALYPSSGTPVDPWADETPTSAPRQVGSGSSTELRQQQQTAQTSTTSARASTGQDAPPVEGAVRIVEVKAKPGETDGKKWTKYSIVDSNGVEYSTLDKSIADVAEKVKTSREWVEILTETKGKFTNVVEIAPAGQQQALPGTEAL